MTPTSTERDEPREAQQTDDHPNPNYEATYGSNSTTIIPVTGSGSVSGSSSRASGTTRNANRSSSSSSSTTNKSDDALINTYLSRLVDSGDSGDSNSSGHSGSVSSVGNTNGINGSVVNDEKTPLLPRNTELEVEMTREQGFNLSLNLHLNLEEDPVSYYRRILMAQKIQYDKYSNSNGSSGSTSLSSGVSISNKPEDTMESGTKDAGPVSGPGSGLGSPPLHRVGPISYEVTELCQLFLGKWGKVTYTVLVGLYLYGTLTAYATVFAKSLSQRIHIFDTPVVVGMDMDMDTTTSGTTDTGTTSNIDYYVYLLIFTAIVAPLSCMELKEQVNVQVILSLCRVLMLVVMIGTLCISTYYCDSTGPESGSEQCTIFDDYEYNPNPTYSILYDMNLSKIYELLPLLGYAFIMHHSIPALSNPVSSEIINAGPHSKGTYRLHHIFVAAMAICTLSYGLVGVVVGLYFRDAISTTANLNWLTYGKNRGALFHLISYYIVLFPALDVASAFPLNAITLGNSLCSYFTQNSGNNNRGTSHGYKSDTSGGNSGSDDNDDEDNATAPHPQVKKQDGVDITTSTSTTTDPNANTGTNTAFYTIVFRLIAVLPAVLIAATGYDLTIITQFTGICGFYIAYVIPALLSIYSERKLVRRYGISHTHTVCTFGVESMEFVGSGGSGGTEAHSLESQESWLVGLWLRLFNSCLQIYEVCLYSYGYCINTLFMKYFTIIAGCILSVYVTYELICSLYV